MLKDNLGVDYEEFKLYDIPVRRVHVQTKEAARQLDRPCGTYTTITTGPIDELESYENVCKCLTEQLKLHLEPFSERPYVFAGLATEINRLIPLDPEVAKRINPCLSKVLKLNGTEDHYGRKSN